MTLCLKCGAYATPETRDTEEPLCWAHGGGVASDVDPTPRNDFEGHHA